MTPQERQLIADLFYRLATLETAPRDAEAERAIAAGLARAPHAAYALVQTALVQDEALKRADARIRELEDAAAAAAPAAPGGFLDTMRTMMSGHSEAARGSVPSVRPAETPMGAPAGFRNEAAQPGAPYPANRAATGGSFLGTAASAAAGVIGGALLLDGIRSMFGSGHGPFGAVDQANASGAHSPWSGSVGSAADSDLARQAGLDDVARTANTDDSSGGNGGSGLFDNTGDDSDTADPDLDQDFDSGFDAGGDDTA